MNLARRGAHKTAFAPCHEGPTHTRAPVSKEEEGAPGVGDRAARVGSERRKQSCLKPSLRRPRNTKEITAARKRKKGTFRDPHTGAAAGSSGELQRVCFADVNSPRPENRPGCPGIRSDSQGAEQQLPHESQKFLPRPPKRQSHQAQCDTGNELLHNPHWALPQPEKQERAEMRSCPRHHGQRQSLL